MSAITVRGLSPETHRGLKRLAKRHGRSMEAEVRAVLDKAALDAQSEGLGTRLARLAQEAGADLEVERGATERELPVF